MDRQMDKWKDRLRDKGIDKLTDKHTYGRTDILMNGQMERGTERQTDWQAGTIFFAVDIYCEVFGLNI